MSKLFTSMLLAASIAGYFAASAPLQAAAQKSGPTASTSAQGRILTAPRKLVKTTTSFDNAIAAKAAGFQAIDALSVVNCPAAAANCLIEAEQNVQVNGTAANNRWAICTQVDGVFMGQPSCPFLGVIPTGSVFVAGSFKQHQQVAPGNHTVRTFLFTDFGGNLSIYHIDYAVYK
jgi:hypothetical protein